MSKPFFTGVVLAIALAWFPAESGAVPLVGCSFGNDGPAALFQVDSSTGLAANPRPTSLDHVLGLACSPERELFGLTNSAAFNHPSSLFRIDPATGASQLIGSTGLTGLTEGDLAFDGTTGRLYGLYRLNGGMRQLFTVDPQTGAAAAFGASLPGDPSAMAFDANGSLFILDTSLQSLLLIDKNSGLILDSFALNVALGSAAGMAIDASSGMAYVADGEDGGTNKLYTLDLSSGLLTEVGPTGLPRGLSGLTVVPEPSAAILLSAVCICALGRRRRCVL